METAAFEKVLSVNLVGSFIVTKCAIPAMEKNDYGRILLIASIAGKEGNAVRVHDWLALVFGPPGCLSVSLLVTPLPVMPT